MSLGDVIDSGGDLLESARESISEEVVDPVKQGVQDISGYSDRKEANEAMEREAKRQKQMIQDQKKQARKKRRQRKSRLMQALEGQGGPDLFALLGTTQDSL